MITVRLLCLLRGMQCPVVVAVLSEKSGNVDAVPMQWMKSPTSWMQYIVMEEAVPMKLDAVLLQWLQ